MHGVVGDLISVRERRFDQRRIDNDTPPLAIDSFAN